MNVYVMLDGTIVLWGVCVCVYMCVCVCVGVNPITPPRGPRRAALIIVLANVIGTTVLCVMQYMF